ncbi:Putative nuclease HARBI1, partial [Linum grandiflorum]
HDGRVLRDAVSRRNGLRVPKGQYYLADAGYTNCEGFLTPFRGQRYHLKEWGPGPLRPNTPEEFYNMKHSSARNVIERAFGLLKMRWGILRDTTWFSPDVVARMVHACCLLHNFIRREVGVDGLEKAFNNRGRWQPNADPPIDEPIEDVISIMQPTPEWTAFRAQKAQELWNNRRGMF